MKPDVVGEPVVAKEHGYDTITILGAVRLAEHVGVISVVAPPPRPGEHATVGRDPANLFTGEERQDELAHGPFGRPHAPATSSKAALVFLDSETHLSHGVVRVSEPRREGRARSIDRGAVGVGEERKDRVKERRRRHLDLSALLERAV